MPGPILIAGQVETLQLKGQKPVPDPILIAEQVETLQLKDRNLCPVQSSLSDKWKPYN